MKRRSDLHLARKAYHFLGVMLIVVLYHVLTRQQGLIALSLSALFLVSCDFIRLRVRALNEFAFKYFRIFMRKEEMHRPSGMAFLLTGALIIVMFFPPSIVTLSLLFLAIADPIASIVGVMYGKDKIVGNKSLQGTMASFVTCTIVSVLYFYFNGMMLDRLILVSLICGLIGAITELVPLWKMDDNFSIPVVGSCLLWVVYYFFGGFA